MVESTNASISITGVRTGNGNAEIRGITVHKVNIIKMPYFVSEEVML